jgi:hypothetical protein
MLDTLKRSQMRKKKAYSAANLLAVTYKLYNALDMQLQVLEQQNSLLAVIKPYLAKQVVLVIKTSSSKSLIFIVSTLVTNA